MNTVHIQIGDVYSKIAKAPPRAWPIVRNACRARPDGFQFMPKYRRGTWDGYITLMRGVYHFPTGLVDIVIDALSDKGYDAELEWPVLLREPPSHPVPTNILRNVSLRDYQEKAVNTLLDYERGIAKMATNAGKTVVFAAIIKYLGNDHAVVIVQSRDLLYQTSARLEEYLGRRVGLIGDSHCDSIDVVVATIQTLDSLRSRVGSRKEFTKLFSNNRILVIDECHHTAHNKTFDILMDIPGWFRFGFSGTPLMRTRLDDLKLIACTGEVAIDIGNTELIEKEWSAVPQIYVHDVPPTPTSWWPSDYHIAYAKCILEHEKRNLLIRDIALEEIQRGPVLIVVQRIEHGELLEEMISAHQPDVIFVNGGSAMDERENVLNALGMGKKMIAIATSIFDEGVDVPALDSVILACGGKSRIKLLQRIGRGLRYKDGENIVHIHDFVDSSNKYLLQHSEERIDAYKEEGFTVTLESE